jgi:hypothetical protein
MKKILFILILTIVFSSFIFPHAASQVNLKYDKRTNMLTINIIHPISGTKVSDPKKHYIKEITVSVNGKAVILEAIKYQQSDKGEISSFLLNVKRNDKVSVKTVCSISGTKIEQITIK